MSLSSCQWFMVAKKRTVVHRPLHTCTKQQWTSPEANFIIMLPIMQSFITKVSCGQKKRDSVRTHHDESCRDEKTAEMRR